MILIVDICMLKEFQDQNVPDTWSIFAETYLILN